MKDAEVQTIVDSAVGPRVFSKTPLPEFEFPQFLYKARTVLWLQFALALTACVSLSRDDSLSPANHKFGVFCAILLFLFISAVHLPNSEYLFRPHPVFWRVLQGLSFVYVTLLVYLLSQNLRDARELLKVLDAKLGVPLPERSYATQCDLYTPDNDESSFANLKDCIFDVHTLAHALGWWFKMMIVRDYKLCMFLSVLFEFMEITLRHQLPNFWECWWDSLVMDVIVCNGGGIYLGWITCRIFEVKEYHWGMGNDARSESGKFSALSRSAKQLTPYSWAVYKWNMFASSKNFVTTLWYIAFVNLVDLSNFYMKYILWVPANHNILLYRVLFWAFLAIASTREYYEYVTSGFKIRLGTHCWMAHLIIGCEWFFILKHSPGLFHDSMPLWIQYTWSLVAGFLLTIGITLFYKDLTKK
jgi:phosphatidylserine synthase 2